ncbi:hypothetical protein ASC97_26985 [Rhizobium sp. Root1203]|nr:hypothetical protein ASC97_26985 [Rhizobium sp. Root1203]
MGSRGMIKLSASLYAADPLRLADNIDSVSSYVDSFHIDIMDGWFSPEFGLYGRLVEHIQDYTKVPLDVHLMLRHPMNAAIRFSEMGVRSVAFHLEGDHCSSEIAAAIKSNGARAFAAIRHGTHVSQLEQVTDFADGFLFLTAPAGGGPFDENAFKRLSARPPGLQTVVDGKIDPSHFGRLAELHVETAVVGAAMFSHGNNARRASELAALIGPSG